MEIGKKLKSARVQSGMTQETVAEKSMYQGRQFLTGKMKSLIQTLSVYWS